MSCNICNVASGNVKRITKRLADAFSAIFDKNKNHKGHAQEPSIVVIHCPQYCDLSRSSQNRKQERSSIEDAEAKSSQSSRIIVGHVNENKNNVPGIPSGEKVTNTEIQDMAAVKLHDSSSTNLSDSPIGIEPDPETDSIQSIPSLAMASTDDEGSNADDLLKYEISFSTPTRKGSSGSLLSARPGVDDATNDVVAWSLLAAVLSGPAPSPVLHKDTIARKSKSEISKLWEDGEDPMDFFDCLEEDDLTC